MTNSTNDSATEPLLNTPWTDADIVKLDSETIARYAYQLSDFLKRRYPSIELFLSHWQGQRRVYGLASGPFVDGGPDEATIKQEWRVSPSLRAEFNESFEAYCAFLRASRGGQVRILRT